MPPKKRVCQGEPCDKGRRVLLRRRDRERRSSRESIGIDPIDEGRDCIGRRDVRRFRSATRGDVEDQDRPGGGSGDDGAPVISQWSVNVR